jgi:hypothetical protein
VDSARQYRHNISLPVPGADRRVGGFARLNSTWEEKLVRAIIFAAALMIGGVALAQDAPPADTPPAADAAAPAADATPPADTPPAANTAAPASADTSYPPCSAKVQDHCTQGAHKASSHKPAKKTHHK